MAWSADTLGYEDWDGSRYEGIPDSPADAAGIFIHSHNDATGEDDYKWIWTYDEFYTWDEWVEHVWLVMEGYGVELG